jgi:hypothetical protein
MAVNLGLLGAESDPVGDLTVTDLQPADTGSSPTVEDDDRADLDPKPAASFDDEDDSDDEDDDERAEHEREDGDEHEDEREEEHDDD